MPLETDTPCASHPGGSRGSGGGLGGSGGGAEATMTQPTPISQPLTRYAGLAGGKLCAASAAALPVKPCTVEFVKFTWPPAPSTKRLPTSTWPEALPLPRFSKKFCARRVQVRQTDVATLWRHRHEHDRPRAVQRRYIGVRREGTVAARVRKHDEKGAAEAGQRICRGHGCETCQPARGDIAGQRNRACCGDHDQAGGQGAVDRQWNGVHEIDHARGRGEWAEE